MNRSPTLRIYKSSSFDKRCNIFLHLLAREYETKSSHRRVHHITGTLLTKGKCDLKKVWTHTSAQRICSDGRFAFCNNYQECFDCGQVPVRGKLKARFQLRREKERKILDGIIMDGVSVYYKMSIDSSNRGNQAGHYAEATESATLPYHGHRASLCAVTKDCCLLRLDLETGKTLEKVTLGPPAVRFQKIHWNQVDESLVISSILYPRQPVHFMRQAGLEITDVIKLIVLRCMPLGFVSKLSVTKQVFGGHTVDASISMDFLMVMYSSDHIRMYSFPSLLEQSKTHCHELYDVMPDGSTFGSDRCPLTHNVKIEECPPCLLEVRCRNRDVMITVPPCHYVMWPVEKSQGYCCYSVRTEKRIENGCMEAEDNSLEEKVALHADDSGRIIQMNNSQLKIFKLVPVEDGEDRALVEDFTIDCSSSPQPQTPTLSVSLSGRIIKKRVIQEASDFPDPTVLSLMYSEDLDMIIVLSTKLDNSALGECTSRTMVSFYDNWNGKLLRQLELEDAPTDEVEERSFGYDQDTVTHVFKTLKGKVECHVYKFQMGTDDAPTGSTKVKPSKPRQRSVSRRARARER